MARPSYTIADLNQMDQATFVDAIGFIFENTPRFAEQAWQQRPFSDREALFATMLERLDASSQDDKLALIRAHPDLVGRAALAGTLGPESTNEQASAGLNSLSPDEIAQFQAFNTAYWERFEFPFVICVRENKKAAILAGFAQRLEHGREREIETAIEEIKKIVRLRFNDVIKE
jgi:2-oxo-4-hydroxy-4-carboxy-5-ureidoimidazoline decarboxylase